MLLSILFDTLVLLKLRALSFVNPTFIEATFAPLASTSCVLALATLAFLAVFKVLIKDFFWMDILCSCNLNFCLSFGRSHCNAMRVPIDAAALTGFREPRINHLRAGAVTASVGHGEKLTMSVKI
jgi:hypothetical protein